ncbi:J domain-containing protein [Luteipulveratus halotolerans]|uniref:J domain-containing protein n=1 Tax=Luteipulveratus halotolerans TaxID=1631356 RepID=UPI0006809EE0|nr:J domain-containing protein [Luteipulveratus halotolerans]
MTHYDVLGVEPTATQDDLRLAFHRKIRKAHPDLGGEDKALAQELHFAYETLRTPEKRAEYDASLAGHVSDSADHSAFEEPAAPQDDWGEEVADDDFGSTDEVIVDDAPEVVDDWGDEEDVDELSAHEPAPHWQPPRPDWQEPAPQWQQAPPMPTDAWSYSAHAHQPGMPWPAQQYSPPTPPRLRWPRGWALIPLGLLLAYTFVPSIIEAVGSSGLMSLSTMMWLIPIWAIGYAAAKTRVMAARITKGYAVFVAVILGLGALFLLMEGGWAMTAMSGIWVSLYVWTVEMWARQAVRDAARQARS